MPRLTPEEQKREVALIRDVMCWPRWPYLPMKQYQKNGEFPICATLVDRGTPGESIKIEPVVLYEYFIYGNTPLEEAKVVARYDTIEAMVADDWVGD
jgi:hypothetical protein